MGTKDSKSQKPQEKVITKISVTGFKSLVNPTSIEVRPLTVLAGANSSGKSSILQPLLMLKQTLDPFSDPGPLAINGDHVHFSEPAQFLSKLKGQEQADKLAVELEFDAGETWSVSFCPSESKDIELNEMSMFGPGPSRRVFRADMTHEEIAKLVPEVREEDRKEREKSAKEELHWRIVEQRCFYGYTFDPLASDDMTFWTPAETKDVAARISDVIHVPGLRGRPERMYQKVAHRTTFTGSFLNHVASIVMSWQELGGLEPGQLGDALEQLGLTWIVKAEKVNGTHIELRVGRLAHSTQGGAQDLVCIADVGFGVSQVLPVLVALTVAKPGQLVYIEQPELHLHPRAQTALAGILADAAKRGVRVVIETHSSLLLLGIQTLVADGTLDPELVKLHWFTRNPDGVTDVFPANVDEAGRFGEWPEDFADTTLAMHRKYADAAHKRIKKQ